MGCNTEATKSTFVPHSACLTLYRFIAGFVSPVACSDMNYIFAELYIFSLHLDLAFVDILELFALSSLLLFPTGLLSQ